MSDKKDENAEAQTFGPFTLVKELGRGQFGRVWLGVSDGKQYAVKQFWPTVSTEELRTEFINTFCIRFAQHRNLVKLCRSMVSERALVFEFCNAGTLLALVKRRIESQVYLTPLELHAAAVQLTSGLSSLHRGGVYHRDVSLRNVFLHKDSSGFLILKIGDFGLAKYVGSANTAKTKGRSGTIMLAPEVDGQHLYTDRADIFSLGIMLACLASLTVVVHGTYSLPDLHQRELEKKELERHLQSQPCTSRYSPQMLSVIAAMISSDPKSRPALEAVNKTLSEMDAKGWDEKPSVAEDGLIRAVSGDYDDTEPDNRALSTAMLNSKGSTPSSMRSSNGNSTDTVVTMRGAMTIDDEMMLTWRSNADVKTLRTIVESKLEPQHDRDTSSVNSDLGSLKAGESNKEINAVTPVKTTAGMSPVPPVSAPSGGWTYNEPEDAALRGASPTTTGLANSNAGSAGGSPHGLLTKPQPMVFDLQAQKWSPRQQLGSEFGDSPPQSAEGPTIAAAAVMKRVGSDQSIESFLSDEDSKVAKDSVFAQRQAQLAQQESKSAAAVAATSTANAAGSAGPVSPTRNARDSISTGLSIDIGDDSQSQLARTESNALGEIEAKMKTIVVTAEHVRTPSNYAKLQKEIIGQNGVAEKKVLPVEFPKEPAPQARMSDKSFAMCSELVKQCCEAADSRQVLDILTVYADPALHLSPHDLLEAFLQALFVADGSSTPSVEMMISVTQALQLWADTYPADFDEPMHRQLEKFFPHKFKSMFKSLLQKSPSRVRLDTVSGFVFWLPALGKNKPPQIAAHLTRLVMDDIQVMTARDLALFTQLYHTDYLRRWVATEVLDAFTKKRGDKVLNDFFAVMEECAVLGNLCSADMILSALRNPIVLRLFSAGDQKRILGEYKPTRGPAPNCMPLARWSQLALNRVVYLDPKAPGLLERAAAVREAHGGMSAFWEQWKGKLTLCSLKFACDILGWAELRFRLYSMAPLGPALVTAVHRWANELKDPLRPEDISFVFDCLTGASRYFEDLAAKDDKQLGNDFKFGGPSSWPAEVKQREQEPNVENLLEPYLTHGELFSVALRCLSRAAPSVLYACGLPQGLLSLFSLARAEKHVQELLRFAHNRPMMRGWLHAMAEALNRGLIVEAVPDEKAIAEVNRALLEPWVQTNRMLCLSDKHSALEFNTLVMATHLQMLTVAPSVASHIGNSLFSKVLASLFTGLSHINHPLSAASLAKFLGLCSTVLRFVLTEPDTDNKQSAGFKFSLRFNLATGAWHDEACVVAMQQCCAAFIKRRNEASDKRTPDKRFQVTTWSQTLDSTEAACQELRDLMGQIHQGAQVHNLVQEFCVFLRTGAKDTFQTDERTLQLQVSAVLALLAKARCLPGKGK